MTSPSNATSHPTDPGHPGGQVHQGHEGPALTMAWIAVTLMIIGFGLCVLALPVESARLVLLIIGGAIGLVGIIVGAAGGIMNNVE